ncbi:MAG: J domain-containing protein [Nitrospinaceae bacterium]
MTTGPTDHYQVLEVAPQATFLEIKRAYRRQAKRFHPDRIPHASAEDQVRFSRIAEAYTVLSDLDKRRAYDASRNAEDASRPDAAPGWNRRHYSGYPYFQFDLVTPYLHAFFMGGGQAGTDRKPNLGALLFNSRTLAVALLGALYFFKFFSAFEGSVMEKKIEDRWFSSVAYRLVIDRGTEKPKIRSVKFQLYEQVKVEDKIKKPLFSMSYFINGQRIPGPSWVQFLQQTALIYLVITGGLFFLNFARK